MTNERERIEAERAEVVRTQQLRWKFLLELYRDNKSVAPGHLQSVHAEEIGRRIGLADQRELEQIWQYLNDAHLLELMAMGPTLAITKWGIDEVEQAYREPDKRTVHLPPLNVIYNVIHGGVHGSTVQQGTTSSTQSVDQSHRVDWDSLRAILRDLRSSADGLPGDQRDEVLAEVAGVEAQSQSPRPKLPIVQMCLTSLRAVLANTAGDLAAAPLIEWMKLHHWMF
jgi:hypothetical protein